MKAKAYVRLVKSCIPVQRAANKVWADKLEGCLAKGDGTRAASKACLEKAYKAYHKRIGKKCLPLLKDERENERKGRGLGAAGGWLLPLMIAIPFVPPF